MSALSFCLVSPCFVSGFVVSLPGLCLDVNIPPNKGLALRLPPSPGRYQPKNKDKTRQDKDKVEEKDKDKVFSMFV
jgi:hypothetical protein